MLVLGVVVAGRIEEAPSVLVVPRMVSEDFSIDIFDWEDTEWDEGVASVAAAFVVWAFSSIIRF